MNHFLRSWHRLTLGGMTALMSLLAAPSAQAQCPPTAATCTPGRATSAQANLFNMGITNVTLGTINNTTAGYSDGYRDYGCATPSISTSLLVGQNYPISVSTNTTASAANENVRVWIDYNNDGVFSPTSELVLSSNSAKVHTATFAPPASAVLNTALRMRVSADYENSVIPTPCSTPVYSQVEDYSVRILTNANPPIGSFTVDRTTTCSGCVQFTDASQNVPTTWLWSFGDMTTSPLPNPNHCYTTPGTYNVTLTVTNGAGTNTTTATTITYTTQVPLAAACSPGTTGFCCNYGVTRFRLNTIDNTSADGSAGYQDFTCPQRTSLIVGNPYTLNITTGGTLPHDTRVFLDGNNDGVLTTSEMVFEALNRANPTGSFTLPGTVVANQPLRLRIVTDAVGNNPRPCNNPVSGQVEDYTIIALPNTFPPVTDFTSNYVPGGCINPIQFTDLSTGGPTAWSWDFGDSSTPSTLPNPSHQYAATGTYTVTLTTTNANGTNTLSRTNYVTVSVPCLVYCASNGAGNGTNPSQFWMTNVAVSAPTPDPNLTYVPFASTTGNAAGGYGNYTSQTIYLRANQSHTLRVVSNLSFAHRTSAWIDYNRDGIFATSELVANGVTAAGPTATTYTVNFTVPVTVPTNVSTVGTTRLRLQAAVTNNAPNACQTNIINAEVEDYTVQILPVITAVREAQSLPSLTVYPNPTLDGHLHLHLSDGQAAGTYAATVENLLGATLLNTSLRLAPSADAELNLSTLPQGVYLLRLRDAQGHSALRRVVRE
jgi:PKD repeat protein